MKFLLFSFAAFMIINGQVLVSDGDYAQDFGTSDINSWSNNSTYTGWYMDSKNSTNFSFRGHVDITTAGPTNSGGFYTYECNGNNDQKIGSRPSNTSADGGSNSGYHYIGLRFVNNTPQTIYSIEISYEAFQLSLAGMGGNASSFTVSYQVSAGSITALNAGAWNSISDLTFVTPNVSASTSSSPQFEGYACNVTEILTACVPVTIAPGEELMIRWEDLNNTYNDPHIAIDNIFVGFDFVGNSCVNVLPVEWGAVWGLHDEEEDVNDIFWVTHSEKNTAFFEVQYLNDFNLFETIGTTDAQGNTSNVTEYKLQHFNYDRKINYYRVKQVDLDGSYDFSEIVIIDNTDTEGLKISNSRVSQGQNINITNPKMQEVFVFNAIGKLVADDKQELMILNTANWAKGFYFVTTFNESYKIIVE